MPEDIFVLWAVAVLALAMGSNALHVLALGECPSPQMFGFSKKKKLVSQLNCGVIWLTIVEINMGWDEFKNLEFSSMFSVHPKNWVSRDESGLSLE